MTTKKVFAEIITIGDEILYGQITDTNAKFISVELDKIGFHVCRKTSISDSREAIFEALSEAEQRADLVVMTGGLGPTKDDITKKTLADYLGVGLVQDADTLAHLEYLFTSRGRAELIAINKVQADVPQGCKVLKNEVGTAPGMWLERNGKVFISMPGVPHETEKMFVEKAIPALQSQFKTPFIVHRFIKTINIAESLLSNTIENWENALPAHIKLAYLPKMGQVRLRLTGTGYDLEQLNAEINQEIEKLKPLIAHNIYGYDDENIEDVIARLLLKQGKTIATAESCTGGYVAHLLTSIAGSSRYFEGGIVSYSNQVKIYQLGIDASIIEQYGAVSEQTAAAMANNVRQRYGTSIGIATTGVAGPGGGSDEKPVGTLCIGYSDGTETITKRVVFTKDRETNIKAFANFMLNLLRTKLEKA